MGTDEDWEALVLFLPEDWESLASRLDFLEAADGLPVHGTRQWAIDLRGHDGHRVAGRLCLVRRPEATAELERQRILREARKKKRRAMPQTLRSAS